MPDCTWPHWQHHRQRLLRAASSLLTGMIRILSRDTSLWGDDVWLVDSTRVGCGCVRETARRSDLAGWAQYGYHASHSRYFRGLRLHLVCTRGGLPVLFDLTAEKADERETLRDTLDTASDAEAARPGQTISGDKNYCGREFECDLAERHLELLRPARKGEAERAGAHLFKPLRQVVESVNQTVEGGSTWNDTAARARQGWWLASCAGSSCSQR